MESEHIQANHNQLLTTDFAAENLTLCNPSKLDWVNLTVTNQTLLRMDFPALHLTNRVTNK